MFVILQKKIVNWVFVWMRDTAKKHHEGIRRRRVLANRTPVRGVVVSEESAHDREIIPQGQPQGTPQSVRRNTAGGGTYF